MGDEVDLVKQLVFPIELLQTTLRLDIMMWATAIQWVIIVI